MAEQRLCKHKGNCIQNACKGFAVSFLQSLAAKSALHILLNFILKKGYRKPIECLLKLVSIDTLKFVGFASLMNFLFKATLCAMRFFRKKEDGLNHLVAGGIGGLAIFLEDKERRETWSLYLTARLVDILLRKGVKEYAPGVNVNNVEVYMFMAMIVFLVYCYAAEKDTLIRSYYNFLDLIFSPSKMEKTVMNVWSAQNTAKYPIK